MKSTISSNGEIEIPAVMREQDILLPGQSFEIERLAEGKYLLTRSPCKDNLGFVDWLLACPEKDWFIPMPSESTENL